MEKEVWNTDDLEPWQIDQLLEVLRRYREKVEIWRNGGSRGKLHNDN